MDEESKVVDVVNGTFDPGGGVGPIVLAYTGETPPRRVLVTHDADGNHIARPYDDEEAAGPAAATPANTAADEDETDGGEGAAGAGPEPAPA